MQYHVLVFLNSFAVFLSICVLTLLGILLYKQRDRTSKILLVFFTFFFCYGMAMLVLNYTTYIISSPVIIKSQDALITVLFPLMYGTWMDYVIQFRTERQKTYRKYLYIICSICLIAWVADSLLFVDGGLNVLNKTGSQVTTLIECAALVIMVWFCAQTMRNEKCGKYVHYQTVIMLAFLICSVIADIQLSFLGYNYQTFLLSGKMTGDWFVSIMFCLLTNMLGLVFSASQFMTFIRDAKAAESEQRAVQYTIQEMADQFQISKREMDVLRLIYEGRNNQQIAEELFISLNTVKKHVNSIFRKVGVDSRTALITKIRLKIE